MPDPTKVDVEKFIRPKHEFTESEISKWTRRSQKEGLCGILNCYITPTTQCPNCTNYYCGEHYESYIDIVRDGELEFHERGDKSLDYYS